MENKINEYSWLASLSLFGELYNKSFDIYEIIGMFLTQIIKSENKYRFKLNEITNLFNEIYHFGILDAVIHPALKRLPFIEKTEGYYLVDRSKLPQEDKIAIKQADAFATNDGVISALVLYIEQKKGVQINENEKTKIIHSFCAFLLDEKLIHEDYTEYISAFIVQTQENIAFKTAIDRIREGVILYTGLKYDQNLNELGTWNTALTIYLDTEIIFHYAGYNGEVYKKFFNDFYTLVKEINGKAQKKLITLKYFTDTKYEIESFFEKAKFIIEGKDKPNPSVTAMMSIIDGCNTASDILNKKTDLFYNLRTVGILEDDYSGYYNEENRIYNMFDQQTIDCIANNIGKDPSAYIKFLNFISILRKNSHSNNFANIGYIFLTGNSNTLKISWNDKIKINGNVPLATHLSWMTNKFWFKMNKGLGNKSFPSTLDAITKAQMLLSSIINNSISGKYDEMQLKFKNGSIT